MNSIDRWLICFLLFAVFGWWAWAVIILAFVAAYVEFMIPRLWAFYKKKTA